MRTTIRRSHLAALALSAILLAPAAGQAASLPVNTAVEPASDLILVRDGQENRHWRDYPGAMFDGPSELGSRFDLHLGASRGFALQPPRYPIEPAPPVVAPAGQNSGFALTPVPSMGGRSIGDRHVPSGGKM